MAVSYIDELEEVVDIVATWAYEVVEEVITAISPDGKPFGMKPKTQEEKIEEYLVLRGNPEKWGQWITSNADFITKKLRESGVAEDKVLSVHPYDLAIRLAVKYSADMEPLVQGITK